MRRKLSIPLLQFLLDGDRTAQSFDDTVKLSQQVISGRVDDSAAMLLNQGSHNLPVGGESTECRFLVFAHQTAIALDVSAENRGESAGDSLGIHRGALTEEESAGPNSRVRSLLL